MMCVARRIESALLDVDGTLVDSNDAHAVAWTDTFAEFGYIVDFDRVRRLIGMGADQLLPTAIGVAEDSELGERLTRRRQEIFFERCLPYIAPLPGAHELIGVLRRRGLELVVATSAEESELRALLRIVGAEDLAESAATSSHVARSKPAPDVVGAALERSGSSPDAALMVGDTPYDISAASLAGVDIVAFRSGGWDDAALAGAIAIYAGPADLLAHFAASPFARRGRWTADPAVAPSPAAPG